MKFLLILTVIMGIGWYGYTTYFDKPTELKPKDNDYPAAGVCDFQSGQSVSIVIRDDIPSPRCVKIRSNQGIIIENDTLKVVQIWFDNVSPSVLYPSSADLRPDSRHVFAKKAGDFMETGVHILHTSIYNNQGGPEIWLIE